MSKERRAELADAINCALVAKEKGEGEGVGQSKLWENLAQLDYYQDLLCNLGMRVCVEKGKVCLKSRLMSYDEESIDKVRARYPEFGKRNSNRDESVTGIENWVKLDNRLKVKNYLPFAFDTSKCQRFQLTALPKANV